MKYLKSFEDSFSKYSRDNTYKYLNSEETTKIKDVIEKFIESKNLPDMIENLTNDDFQSYLGNFFYKDIYQNLLIGSVYDEYNIYYVVDLYCKENNIHGVPSIRNSMQDIINSVYIKKYEKLLTPLFDKKIIELIQENPNIYEELLELYEDELSDVVKKECEHIKVHGKYNL